MPQTLTLTVAFIGGNRTTRSYTRAPGERWEENLATFAEFPLVSIHNATVKVECSPMFCPTWATIYADTLKRGSTASHPEIKWGCSR